MSSKTYKKDKTKKKRKHLVKKITNKKLQERRKFWKKHQDKKTFKRKHLAKKISKKKLQERRKSKKKHQNKSKLKMMTR